MNKRQIEILRILYGQKDFVTLSQIASAVGVSAKTVRNNLSAIRAESLKPGNLVTRPNKGVRLTLSPEEYERLVGAGEERPAPADYKSQRDLAAAFLLLKNPLITLEQIGEAIYLSKSSANKAVQEAEAWLAKHGVTVQRGRRKGLSVAYEEYGWRTAMWELFQKRDDLSLLCQNKMAGLHSIDRTCDDIRWFLDGFDAGPAAKILGAFEQEHGILFSYDSRQRLLFHLSVSILRSGKGRAVSVPGLLGYGYDTEFDRLLADSLAKRVEEAYRIRVPGEERLYLQYQIGISEPQDFANSSARQYFEFHYPKLCAITDRIIGLFSRILGMDFASDMTLFHNLFLSLRSMIARLSQGVKAENPLLGHVRLKYPKILAAAWSVSVVLESETGLAVNENELGLLALDICGSVERISLCSHILILCNYGVSVSRLMKVLLEKEVIGIVVDGVISVSDEKAAWRSNCDFIISSIPVSKTFGGKDVVMVDSFLPPSDLNAIREKMQSIRNRKKRRVSVGASESAAEVPGLFDEKFIRLDVQAADKEKLLREMCGAAEEAGFVSPEYAASVFSREKITSTGIGGGMAIPHGAIKFVNRPLISVARLKDPILWFQENRVDLVFLLAFNLTGSAPKDERVLKFYSALTSLLDSEEERKKLRQLKTPAEFARYMNAIIKGEEQAI